MRRPTRTLVLAAAVVLAAGGGGVYAYADWTVAMSPAKLTMRTVSMPAGNAPSVARSGRNVTLRWVPNRVGSGLRPESYIVTRITAGESHIVCDRVTTASCRDKQVPPGTHTWRVRPVLGHWEGPDSLDSVPLSIEAAKAPATADEQPASRPRTESAAEPTPADSTPPTERTVAPVPTPTRTPATTPAPAAEPDPPTATETETDDAGGPTGTA